MLLYEKELCVKHNDSAYTKFILYDLVFLCHSLQDNPILRASQRLIVLIDYPEYIFWIHAFGLKMRDLATIKRK